MKDRALMVATVPSMIGQFNMNNIRMLQDLGYEVDVACNFSDTTVWPEDRIKQFKDNMKARGVSCFHLSFSRKLSKINRHFLSYRELKKLIHRRHYSLIHTHTPIASVIVRLAARKMKVVLIYTAHGFHFYSGAPFLNWMMFYPLEKWLSRYTDVLITINKEDYRRALASFNARKTVYVPGIGVDIHKFAYRQDAKDRIRSELNITNNQILFLSVGELNRNKNHETVVKAIRDINATYIIVGEGALKESIKSVSAKYGVDVRMVGFRKDVADFYSAADIYILPSIREGLNVSLMEAMASGLPVVCGRIRGNVDLIEEEKGGSLFNPVSENDLKHKLTNLLEKREQFKDIGRYNQAKIKSFSCEAVNQMMETIYRSCFDDEG